MTETRLAELLPCMVCEMLFKKPTVNRFTLWKASLLTSSKGKKNEICLYFHNVNVWVLIMNKKLSYSTSHFPTVCPGPTWTVRLSQAVQELQIPGKDRVWKGTLVWQLNQLVVFSLGWKIKRKTLESEYTIEMHCWKWRGRGAH